MKYSSTALLDDLYEQTERNLNKAVSEWQHLPAVRLKTAPAPGSWTAIQCLAHLNSYGRYYLPEMEKAINAAIATKPAVFFKSSLLGNYFYKLMLPQSNGRLKKKLKSPKDHVPQLELETAAVLNEFISQQELLGRILIRAGLVNINKASVPISIARFVKLKLGDTLLFYVAHINRHILQAERALQAENLSMPGYATQANNA